MTDRPTLCGYLPLALRAAGSLLAITPDLDPADYAVKPKLAEWCEQTNT